MPAKCKIRREGGGGVKVQDTHFSQSGFYQKVGNQYVQVH